MSHSSARLSLIPIPCWRPPVSGPAGAFCQDSRIRSYRSAVGLDELARVFGPSKPGFAALHRGESPAWGPPTATMAKKSAGQPPTLTRGARWNRTIDLSIISARIKSNPLGPLPAVSWVSYPTTVAGVPQACHREKSSPVTNGHCRSSLIRHSAFVPDPLGVARLWHEPHRRGTPRGAPGGCPPSWEVSGRMMRTWLCRKSRTGMPARSLTSSSWRPVPPRIHRLGSS
jgi:hypothetical protein